MNEVQFDPHNVQGCTNHTAKTPAPKKAAGQNLEPAGADGGGS